MHACGHDAHVAMLLGAAKLLQSNKHKLANGTVKLVFQPGEESRAGAYHMIKEGALDNFQAIFGLHVAPEMPFGSIGSRPGPFLAGSARFLAVAKGVGGHAASPHVTRDPVLAVSSAILVLQQIISCESDPLQVISVGFVEAGQAGNVIPETVKFGGTFRSMTTEGMSFLQQRIREAIEMQAKVHSCSATVDFMEETMRPYVATVKEESMYNHAERVGEVMLGESNVKLLPMTMGAEDFGFYSEKKKAVDDGVQRESRELHSPLFRVLPIGSALHAAVAVSYLEGHAS